VSRSVTQVQLPTVPTEPSLFLLLTPRPQRPTLFPYTTLFRSSSRRGTRRRGTGSRASRLARSSSAPRWTASSRRCTARTRTSSRSEEHTSELQSRGHLVCRLLLEKKKNISDATYHTSHIHRDA